MRYFVVSDIHSFATELKWSLGSAGFNKRSKDCTLIILGDIFDRGKETLAVYNYIKSIPKKRRILVRGNHEQLYLSLLEKKYPEGHDFSNRTVSTFVQIAGYSDAEYDFLARNCSSIYGGCLSDSEIDPDAQALWDSIKTAVAEHEITTWLRSNEWVNYAEIDRYIFVHSFIPHSDDWRQASAYEWQEATWGCPFRQYQQGFFNTEMDAGKCLVVGHWHTGDFFKTLSNKELTTNECLLGTIWYGHNLIGLDGGTYRDYLGNYIHPQTVLIIDSTDFNTCYNQYKEKLSFED